MPEGREARHARDGVRDHPHAARASSSAAPARRPRRWGGRSPPRPARRTTTRTRGSSASRRGSRPACGSATTARAASGKDETGSRVAVPIWVTYMSKVLGDSPKEDFPVPEQVVIAAVDLDPSNECIRVVPDGLRSRHGARGDLRAPSSRCASRSARPPRRRRALTPPASGSPGALPGRDPPDLLAIGRRVEPADGRLSVGLGVVSGTPARAVPYAAAAGTIRRRSAIASSRSARALSSASRLSWTTGSLSITSTASKKRSTSGRRLASSVRAPR